MSLIGCSRAPATTLPASGLDLAGVAVDPTHGDRALAGEKADVVRGDGFRVSGRPSVSTRSERETPDGCGVDWGSEVQILSLRPLFPSNKPGRRQYEPRTAVTDGRISGPHAERLEIRSHGKSALTASTDRAAINLSDTQSVLYGWIQPL